MNLLKAVVSPPHHRHRPPPHHRPLFRGKRWLRRVTRNPPTASNNNNNVLIVDTNRSCGKGICGIAGNRRDRDCKSFGVVSKGAARFPVGWWMGIAPGRAMSASAERGFARRWAGGGPDGGGGEGSNGWSVLAAKEEEEEEDKPKQHTVGSVHHQQVNGSGGGGGGEDGVGINNTSMKMQLQSSKLLTLPTVLTLGRVAAVPLLVNTFYMDSWWATTATTSIFISAAITDWLDGYIARKMRLGTTFGAFLDPVADKLMVAATLVLLCTRPVEVAIFGQAPWLLTIPSIAIIGREITMSAVREWAASQNSQVLEAVAVNNLGKWKTATQMTALAILLATRDSSLTGSGALVASGVVLLYISAGLTVWSLAAYMRKIWGVMPK